MSTYKQDRCPSCNKFVRTIKVDDLQQTIADLEARLDYEQQQTHYLRRKVSGLTQGFRDAYKRLASYNIPKPLRELHGKHFFIRD